MGDADGAGNGAGVVAALEHDGFAVTSSPLLGPETCAELRDGFEDDGRFRSTVDMARHRFGEGCYRYYRHPLQMTVALTEPGRDFGGGDNLFVEQRPRAQSRGTAVTVPLGHAVIFPTRYRPVAGARGYSRVVVRHGVSTVTSGRRYTLGIIFHDAA